MMSTMTERNVCFTFKTELAHRNWLKAGGKGAGRMDLFEKNLTKAFLQGENFTKAKFVRCDWSNSRVSSSNFVEAEITECTWNNSLLYSDNFDRALIERCDFVDTYFGITHFIETKIKGGDWTRSDLDKSTWTDAVVENACFRRVNLWRSKLQGAHFVNCNFREGNLMSVRADNAVFENCDFRGVYLRSFRFNNTKFINCGFHGCIGNPKFEGDCILIEPDLSEAFDGTQIVEPEQLLEQWRAHSGQSQPETVISLDSPQWLDYISRERRAEQADWASGGMKGSLPMDVSGKDLSGAFAYRAYFRAARFTDCDFTASDLRRTMVQQAEFVRCKFDDALLEYVEGRQETSLNVETTKVTFKDCIAKGAYFNRSELWIAEFTGGNWDGSFFNNCMWTLAEFDNVSFENTDWRGAKLDGVKFINCNFKNARFEKAELIAAKFYGCDFRGADFGNSTGGQRVKLEQCGFSGATGMLFDVKPLDEYDTQSADEGKVRIVNADLSPNFDGSLVFESLAQAQDLFYRIGDISSSEQSDSAENLPTTEADKQSQPESAELKGLEQLQQELDNDKQQLKELRSQLKQVEERIQQARKTNIFGRKQSGENERERDRLAQEIKDVKNRIAENESKRSS